MQVTKELIDKDIAGLNAQLEQLKAQAAQTAGALSVLKNIREYMDLPEPEAVPVISDANKAVQDEVEAMSQKEISHALSEQELADLVAGPGASVEAIEPIKVANAQGKYVEQVS